MNFLRFFILSCLPLSFAFLVCSCSSDIPETGFAQENRVKEKNYWNDPGFIQPVLDSCSGFFFPDYFPLNESDNLYKKIIPGDTILYYDLQRVKLVQKNGEIIWYNIDKKTNKLTDLGRKNDVPFLTGIFSSDSSMRLLFQGRNDLGDPTDPKSLNNNPGIYFGIGINPCLKNENRRIIVRGGNWKFHLTEGPVADTLRINSYGTEINYEAQKQYYSKRRKGSGDLEAADTNPLYETAVEIPCIRMSVAYLDKFPEANEDMKAPFSPNYIIWFQRNKGPVKVHCLNDNVIYLIGDGEK